MLVGWSGGCCGVGVAFVGCVCGLWVQRGFVNHICGLGVDFSNLTGVRFTLEEHFRRPFR